MTFNLNNILIFNLIILLILQKVYFIQATIGFDSVDSVTTDIFNNATQSSKIKFFIGRLFNGATYDIPSGEISLNTSVDQVGIQNIQNANNAGLQVDAYFVPRYAQLNENIDSQVIYTLNALKNATLPIKNIWILISRSLHSGWTTDTNLNVNCLTRVLTQFKSNIDNINIKIGIMTSQEALEEIVGKDGAINAKTPFETQLWWKNCNGTSDTFTPFAEWQNPTITQNQCKINNFGINVNMDEN